jgi:hypothetical protein
MTAYGDRASLTLRPGDQGGAKVRVVMPRTIAPKAAPRVETAHA